MKIHQIRIDFCVTDQIKRYVFVYIIEGNYCYLIDSGVGGSEVVIEKYLKSIGRHPSEIKGIFLTHAHPDHIGTAAYFQTKVNCAVYASEGEKRWIEDINLQFHERPIPNFYKLAGKSTLVNQVVKDGDCIPLREEFSVQVIGTPGHSVDEVSYIINDIAFIGDALPVKGDVPIYVNKENTMNSLQKLLKLHTINTFYPAWDKTYSSDEMKERILEAESIVNMLDSEVKTIQKSEPGVGIEKIVRIVCNNMKMSQLMQNPLFKQTIASHMNGLK